MPEITKLPQNKATYRFVVRPAPLWIRPEGQPVAHRPYLLALINMDSSLIVQMQAVDNRPDWEDILDWLSKSMHHPHPKGNRPGRPRRLSVADADTFQGLRFALRSWDIEVVHEPDDSDIHQFFEALAQDHSPECLIAKIGPERALRLMLGLQDLLESKPWKQARASSMLLLQHATRKTPYGVFIMGAGGQEFGILLFANPQDGEKATRGRHVEPLLGLAWAEAPELHYRDLDLLGLHRPGLDYFQHPQVWFGRQSDPLALEAGEWLVENLTPYLKGKAEVLAKNSWQLSSLQPSGPPPSEDEESWEDFEVFAARWTHKGKLSPRKLEVLSYLHQALLRFKYEHHLARRTLAEYRKGCEDIAHWLLTRTKSPFKPHQFSQPPKFKEEFLRQPEATPNRWKRLVTTWKRLGQDFEDELLELLEDEVEDTLGLCQLAEAHLRCRLKLKGAKNGLSEARRLTRHRLPDSPRELLAVGALLRPMIPQIALHLSAVLNELSHKEQDIHLASSALEDTLTDLQQMVGDKL